MWIYSVSNEDSKTYVLNEILGPDCYLRTETRDLGVLIRLVLAWWRKDGARVG